MAKGATANTNEAANMTIKRRGSDENATGTRREAPTTIGSQRQGDADLRL